MHYIIQDGLLNNTHHVKLVEYLERRGLSYERVRFMPFTHEIEFTTDRKDVWVFGSTNMAVASAKFGWNPGTMYNDNHDFELHLKKYGTNMLNHDGHVIGFTDPLPEDIGDENGLFFARPTKDTKIFTGQVFDKDSWEHYVNEVYDNKATVCITGESKILLCTAKNIQQEIRCWIVDGKVATASLYRMGGRSLKKNYDGETAAIDFANSMAQIFQPARAFVMDICLSDDEYKIVEINAINGAGFYEANMGKLVEALEESFGQN